MDYIKSVTNKGDRVAVVLSSGEVMEIRASQLQYISTVLIDNKGNIYERKATRVEVEQGEVTIIRVDGESTPVELKDGDKMTIELMHATRKV
jgi:uncharacterized protein involved in tellurium resistance